MWIADSENGLKIASEMTYIVSSGALNSTHSLTVDSWSKMSGNDWWSYGLIDIKHRRWSVFRFEFVIIKLLFILTIRSKTV